MHLDPPMLMAKSEVSTSRRGTAESVEEEEEVAVCQSEPEVLKPSTPLKHHRESSELEVDGKLSMAALRHLAGQHLLYMQSKRRMNE